MYAFSLPSFSFVRVLIDLYLACGLSDEDVFCELVKFGNLLEMHVCDNVGDHLIGNVYARFDYEEEAIKAVDAMNNRWYAGTFSYSCRPVCSVTVVAGSEKKIKKKKN